jgi:hypothetical protein
MSADQLREIIGRKPFRPVVVTTVAGDVVVPHALFSIVAAVLLGLVGCASQSKPLSVQGKPLSGYVRLTQKQVGFPGSYIATDDVSASVRVDSASGLWLKNASGVILHITPQREQRDKVLSIAGDTVVIKLNRYSPIDHLRNGK